MRSHGIPLFPDPAGNGQISPGSGVDVSSPRFRDAQRACRSLLPRGGSFATGGSRLSPQQQTQMLAYAKCMRAHGVPRFPDPTARGIALEPDVNVGSPLFKAAAQACRSLLPAFAAAGQHTAGSGRVP